MRGSAERYARQRLRSIETNQKLADADNRRKRRWRMLDAEDSLVIALDILREFPALAETSAQIARARSALQIAHSCMVLADLRAQANSVQSIAQED